MGFTSGYNALAPVYDRLNDTVDYGRWADYVEECFARFGADPSKQKPVSVLELGCGTGSMTLELARRGCDLIAMDLSPEMLSVADARARAAGLENILFLEGDMCDFELYGTVQAVVCCLDGINHLARKEELYACFANVARYLEPGGTFVFDLNTPYKFRTVYADRDYILEDEGAMCCWRNRLNRAGDRVDFYLTVFEEQEDGSWRRHDGVEREKAYGLRAIRNALEQNGMELVSVSGGCDFTPPEKNAERWYLTARRKAE